MHRRGLLLMLASAAAGGAVHPAWFLAKAEELEVTKIDEEWRRLTRTSSVSGASA